MKQIKWCFRKVRVRLFSVCIYLWNCWNQAQFLNKKIMMNCLAIEMFAWNFLQLSIQKYNCNSTHGYSRKTWVDASSYIIFSCVPRICPHTIIKIFKSFNGMFLHDRDLRHERVKGKFFWTVELIVIILLSKLFKVN